MSLKLIGLRLSEVFHNQPHLFRSQVDLMPDKITLVKWNGVIPEDSTVNPGGSDTTDPGSDPGSGSDTTDPGSGSGSDTGSGSSGSGGSTGGGSDIGGEDYYE